MKLVSWQSVLTEHQVHLMRAVHDELGGGLDIIVGVRQLSVRQQQGWNEVDGTGLRVTLLPETDWWAVGRALIDANPDAFHLFGGLWADRRFFPLILYAQWRRIATGLVSEPYAEAAVAYFGGGRAWLHRLKSVVRPWFYRAAGVVAGRRMKAVFAISDLAVRQFSEAGFACGHLYPFGYFVPALGSAVPPRKENEQWKVVRLVFVGNLVETKGIAVLLSACRELRAQRGCRAMPELLIDFYGPGEPPHPSALPEGVNFKGCIPFGYAQSVIARYDALILPSLHDGWGVVVNEALLQGVPAVVSDAVGAKALVLRYGGGAVFPAGNAVALASILKRLAGNPQLLEDWRSGAARIGPALNPPVAARYLVACLRHAYGRSSEAPVAPWYSGL